MKKNKIATIKTLVILIVLTIGTIFLFKPLMNNVKYGLDLQGGFEVLYEVKPIDNSKITSSMVNSTYKTIQKRIDVLGVSEPNIILEGKNHIRVQLAGVTSPKEARDILSRTASLTFRDTSDNLLMTSKVLASGGAKLSQDNSGLPAVLLSVKDKDKFFAVTNKIKDQKDNRIVIWLDYVDGEDSYANEGNNCGSLAKSKCLSSATVSQGFASDVIIQGKFSKEEANSLVELINSGSMPTKLTEISSKTVGAMFGEQSLNKTFTAGIIGTILIIILMTLIYRFAGIISAISLILYAFITFLMFYLIGGVLTLPGIAAMALGIGMAVDSNIITFERIKDELYEGKSLINAFKSGNIRSLTTIFDSNTTTLIVAIILFIFGESSVKGFATMLIINIIITMLIMVYLTRFLIGLFIKNKYFENKTNLFVGVNKKDIPDLSNNEKRTFNMFKKLDFVKNSIKCISGSAFIIIVGIIITIVTGLNLSIDYKGGSDITIKTDNKLVLKDIKQDIKDLDYKAMDIQMTTDGAYIKITNELNNKQTDSVEKYFKAKYNANVEVGVVSQVVKKELTINAFYSIIIASIGIIIFISLRFTFNYAIAAIMALLHDVLFVIGMFSIFRLEVSTMFIAALLAIYGYSNNDTIVAFDRIRENLHNLKNNKQNNKQELINIVNNSIRQTLLRSLYTTLATLIPVICLLFFGSNEIFNFNIAMFIGLVVGSYSSIFIASQIWLLFELRSLKKGKKNKKRWFEVEDDEIKELEIKGVNK
jgi:protein-export membrane protein SecD/preprotein translocase SecF subunit